MGLMVSHHDHHRHSAYLMAKVDAAGFSQNQQNRLSALLLGQRGGLKKVAEPLQELLFAWQLLCLRLAVIKCHARGPVEPHALSLSAAGSQTLEARLHFSVAWAQSRPRTVYLLQEDAELWLRHGPLRLLLPS
jgi:exopolyphosphatase / guanosine-5'-triphosphate,3'-diphosphate pyrophosphatase